MRCKFLHILIFVLAIVWILLFIKRHLLYFGIPRYIFGGAFDIDKFIAGLRKKYISPDDHIELELKLKKSGVYERLDSYVRAQPEHTEENTINKIWHDENGTNIIETTIITKNNSAKSNAQTFVKWSTKKRLSKYETELGPIAISLERELNEKPANIHGEPKLVRRKNRISVALNNHWRIDCTQVEQNVGKLDIPKSEQNEVEIEYIAADYWNALSRIGEIKEFLATNCAFT